jgi:hypothetical protein
MPVIHLHGRLEYLPWQNDKKSFPLAVPISIGAQ